MKFHLLEISVASTVAATALLALASCYSRAPGAEYDLAPSPVAMPMSEMADMPTGYRVMGEEERQANTEDYVNYGVNDMVLVATDRLSTFCVDVDTASYAIARRKLNEGILPPEASVRVEEFVNAFSYDYAPPARGSQDGAPFAVHMEAAPSPWTANHHVMRVGVKGLEIAAADRQPVHLTFLVDGPGSMSSPDKLGLAQRALHFLVNNLDEQDTVAIATYAGDTRVVLEPTSASHAREIHDAIDAISSGGGTAMESGMELAYQMAGASAVPGHENRVIVLSDGDANIGGSSHQAMLKRIAGYAEEGITLSTIGFGMGNYKDTMMEQLADQGDGNYFYIDSFSEAKKVFGTDLAGTVQTIARDVKIQVEFNPDAVIAYRLIGYENRDIADEDFRDDQVDAGEIGSGHRVTALYDVVLADGAASTELATVRLRAKPPGPDAEASEWATVFDGSLLRSEWAEASPDLRWAMSAASFAELLRGSPYVAELSWEMLASEAKASSRGSEEDAEMIGLIAKAAALDHRGELATR